MMFYDKYFCLLWGVVHMPKKLTLNDFVTRSNIVHNNKYDYHLSEYNGSKGKVKIVCPEHGIFEQRADQHLSGEGCPDCSPRKLKTLSKFISDAKSIHGDKYDYSLVEYHGSNVPVKIICPDHGVFEQLPYNHLSNKGCPVCGNLASSKKQSSGILSFVKKARAIHGDKYDYSKSMYVNSKTKLTIICPTHGEFEQTPDGHINNQNGCPCCKSDCLSQSQSMSYLDFVNKALSIHGNKYDYSLVVYKNAKKKVKILCPEHGVFEQTPDAHLAGKGCYKCFCASQTSKLEYDVLNYIQSIYDGDIVHPSTDILDGKHLDIFLPELNVAFEVNGCYWHHSDKKSIHYHENKFKMCESKGIQLIQIWEDDWNNHHSATLNLIAAKLGCLNKLWNKSFAFHVGARSCHIDVVDSHVAKSFLNENHIQGAVSASFHFGLFDPLNNLRALLSVRSPKHNARMNRHIGEWEIQRYATVGSIPGGFSKLLKYAESYILDSGLDIFSWVSFSSNDVSDGSMYVKTGFTLDKYCSADYKYVGQVTSWIRRPKEGFQKSKFKSNSSLKFKDGLTESELAELNGLHKVYDSGKKRWVKNVTKV